MFWTRETPLVRNDLHDTSAGSVVFYGTMPAHLNPKEVYIGVGGLTVPIASMSLLRSL